MVINQSSLEKQPSVEAQIRMMEEDPRNKELDELESELEKQTERHVRETPEGYGTREFYRVLEQGRVSSGPGEYGFH